MSEGNPLPNWLEILALKILFTLYLTLIVMVPYIERRFKPRS